MRHENRLICISVSYPRDFGQRLPLLLSSRTKSLGGAPPNPAPKPFETFHSLANLCRTQTFPERPFSRFILFPNPPLPFPPPSPQIPREYESQGGTYLRDPKVGMDNNADPVACRGVPTATLRGSRRRRGNVFLEEAYGPMGF